MPKIKPQVVVAFSCLGLIAFVLLFAGSAVAGEPGEEPPGGDLGNDADIVPEQRWTYLLSTIDKSPNRIHLDNVAGLDECVVGLPARETDHMLDGPAKCARVAEFLFIFRPWRVTHIAATELNPETLVAISKAYEKKGNRKYARFASVIARTLYRQAPPVRIMNGYILHGGGWVRAELMNSSVPALEGEEAEKVTAARKALEAGNIRPAMSLPNTGKYIFYPEVHVLMGDALGKTENRNFAVISRYYLKALELDPAWMEAHERIGWVLCKQAVEEIPEKSPIYKLRETLDDIRVKDRAWSMAHGNLAELMYEVASGYQTNASVIDGMQSAFLAACAGNSGWMDAHDGLAEKLYAVVQKRMSFLQAAMQLDNAVAEVLRYDPDGGKYLLPRAELHFMADESAKAYRLYRKAIELDTSLVLAWSRRAAIHEQAGLVERALEILEEGLAACPAEELLMYDRVHLLSKQDLDHEALKRACIEYLKLFPEGPHAVEVKTSLRSARRKPGKTEKKIPPDIDKRDDDGKKEGEEESMQPGSEPQNEENR
ncbi:MAG: hypothetical protein ACYS8W_02725 [Planctomycetota bacterium]|jgi:tetratricopeptide (TPR) repeat protein